MTEKLIFKHNKEKKYFEKWTPDRKLANFPKPFRMLITGLPNSGKTTTILSIIAQIKPTFDEIILMHAKYFDDALSPNSNDDIEVIPGDEIEIPEYEGIDFTCALPTIPLGYKFFEQFQNEKGSKKNLLIIDDIELSAWSKGRRDRQVAINKLFSYQSTHYGLTIIIAVQDPTSQTPPIVRRECNVFIIFKGRDKNAIQYFAQNVGFDKNVLVKLFGLCKSNHDSICFDFTDESPYPLRYNVINPIELIETPSIKARTGNQK